MSAFVRSFTFGKDVVPECTLTNFFAPEDGFVWSTGTWCEIGFSRPHSASRQNSDPAVLATDIAFDLDVFKVPPDFEGQNVLFYVNGLRLASRFIKARITVMLEFPPSLLRVDENVITIDTPNAALPTDHGLSDTRVLGVQLFNVRLTSG